MLRKEKTVQQMERNRRIWVPKKAVSVGAQCRGAYGVDAKTGCSEENEDGNILWNYGGHGTSAQVLRTRVNTLVVDFCGPL